MELIRLKDNFKVRDMEDMKKYSIYTNGAGYSDRCTFIKYKNDILIANTWINEDINEISFKEPCGNENGNYIFDEDDKNEYIILSLKPEYMELNLDDIYEIYREEYNDTDWKNIRVILIEAYLLEYTNDDLIKLFAEKDKYKRTPYID
jgi:hypothetical protein